MRRQLRRTPYRLARNQQKHPGGPPRFLNPGYVLGEQTSHKQRVVPYVFAHLTLSVERCCFEQGVGFDEHLPHVFKGLALDISNSMETPGTDEVCEIPTRRSPLRLVPRALANTRTHRADTDALHRAHIQHSHCCQLLPHSGIMCVSRGLARATAGQCKNQ